MPSVQVKDFPAELYDQLKAYAELNHRSMAQQLIVAAEQMLATASASAQTPRKHAAASQPTDASDEANRRARIAKRKALFAHIDASNKNAQRRRTWGTGSLDPVMLIREDRDGEGRHGGGLEYDAACEEALR